MAWMDRKTRRQMGLEAKKYGGIAIPHIKLQVHQNGAKFPISKVYIDDEQLDPNMFYTLIIIPEGARLSQQDTVILLMVFDPKLGPDILETLPTGGLNKEARDSCVAWFDSNEKPGFFTASTGKQFGFNLAFEVPNKIRAGGKDIFMLSLITDSKQSVYVEDLAATIYEERVGKLKEEIAMYNSYYPDAKTELTELEKHELETEKLKFHERVKTCLQEIKTELNHSLEIQEKLDDLGGRGKRLELD